MTGDRPVPGVDAPTLRESGVDLEFANWRGLVAPPGPTDAAQTGWSTWSPGCTAAWRAAEAANGWTDDFLTGAASAPSWPARAPGSKDVLDRLGM